MNGYFLTDEAEADLRSIIRYTRKEWEAQVRRYVATLQAGIASLAADKGAFKDMSAIYPALRMSRCERRENANFECRLGREKIGLILRDEFFPHLWMVQEELKERL